MAQSDPPAAARPAPARLRDLGLGALLALATFLAYLPALHGGLVLDDNLHITAPALRSLHGLARIWFDIGVTQQYYPLLHTAFWIEWHLWGASVWEYHLLNVLQHITAACLLVALVRRLRLPGAWIAGFLFALHPVCVESVAWIAEQKNTLSTVFYLAATLAYLRFDADRRPGRYALALFLFACALLSKTSTATLPAALLVVVWWKRGRLAWKGDALPLVPWFALAFAAGMVTKSVEHGLIHGIGVTFHLTWVDRCLVAGRVFWFYLAKLVWPANLTFFYPRWSVNPAVWWQYLFPLGVLALAFVLWRLARRTRGPLAAFLYFAGTLFPVMGFFNVEWFVFSYVADHLQYVAALGLFVAAAAGLARGAAVLPASLRRLAPPAAAALLLALGALTWHQSGFFRSGVALYGRAVKFAPGLAMAHNHFGAALAETPGRKAEAEAQFRIALRMDPDAAEIHANLGTLLLEIPGRQADAIAQLEDAVRLQPDLASAHYRLGTLLAKMPGRTADAAAQFRAALRYIPDDAYVHYNLANALERLPGHGQEAIAQFHAALRLKPDFAEAHNNLGSALLRQPGRLADAIAQFREALRYKPDFPAAYNNLGIAYGSEPGHLQQAITQFEAALRLDPNFRPARDNLMRARAFLQQMQGASP